MVGGAATSLYGVAIIGQTVVSSLSRGIRLGLAALPLLVVTHVFYGLGFWWGLFTRLQKAPGTQVKVDLERINL
jgi:hypothetical protein